MSQESPRVVIGMDPHKRSVTIEVMDGDEHVLGGGRFATDAPGYRSMLDSVHAWPNRVWAVEGCKTDATDAHSVALVGRHRPAGPARHRPLRCCSTAGRGRRHHPVPRPRPLRVLDRHIMAVVQLRNPTEGRSYFDRKKASGKTSMEAMRCLKRRLSDLYKTMLEDLVATQKTGPGGQPGNDSVSSVTGSQPSASSSDKSLLGPAKAKPKRTLPAAS